MDQLEPADRQALLAASVFGQRFGLEALRHLVERPDYGCERLVEHLLVRPEGDDFLFAHALIRDAVYDTLLKASRRSLHRRAAGWFEGRDPVLYAEHLDRAEDPAAPEPTSKPPAARRAPIATNRRRPSFYVASRSRPRRPIARR